jgi:hypothetical protein
MGGTRTTRATHALALLLLVPLRSGGEELRYAPAAGARLERRLELSLELQSTGPTLSVLTDGRMRHESMGTEGRFELLAAIDVADEVVSAGPDGVTELKRRFLLREGSMLLPPQYLDDERPLLLALDGVEVRFERDARDGSYDASFADPEARLAASLLDELPFGLDFQALLPRESPAGEEPWSIAAQDWMRLLFPFGDFGPELTPGERPIRAAAHYCVLPLMPSPRSWIADPVGDVLAIRKGTRRVDELELGVIEVQFDVSCGADVLDGTLEDHPDLRALDFELATVQSLWEGRAVLLWNVEARSMHSVEVEARVHVEHRVDPPRREASIRMQEEWEGRLRLVVAAADPEPAPPR